jgi:hypothetical protein
MAKPASCNSALVSSAVRRKLVAGVLAHITG